MKVTAKKAEKTRPRKLGAKMAAPKERKKAVKPPDERLTHEEFVLLAMRTLGDPRFPGLHVVYSGFNEAFRRYFGSDPIQAVRELVAVGKIKLRVCKGGARIYLPHEIGDVMDADAALEKMGL